MVSTVAGGLGGGFGHIRPGLGLAVVAVARTVIDLGLGVNPHLTVTAAPEPGPSSRELRARAGQGQRSEPTGPPRRNRPGVTPLHTALLALPALLQS